ncbi:MAG: wax ester/triacylglycerol synthase family O-acyltransferase [Porticoccaceae bacterium]|jgi:WS/DGAT/MGAT family acyltransferase|nr:wax ester/triacylglycerol synthase family O-acyltransferase [Porticoccaceae bacterium]
MTQLLMDMTEVSWLALESRDRPMHVATLLIYSLPENAPATFLGDMVARFRESTEFADPFNRRIAHPLLRAMLPLWTRDYDLDMEYHVRHLALPAPGGERELGILISRLHSNPMDLARPLWEYHVIEGLENNRFAVYFKMHHALVDGIAGVHMLQRSMSPDPNDLNTPPLWSAEGPSAPAKSLKKMLKTASGNLSAMAPVAKKLVEVARSALDSDDPLVRPFQTPVSILNHRIHGQRRFATQLYEFARIRRLAKLADCTVNDIVLALCSGALRRFLQELSVLPGQSLTAGIPISLRAKDDQSSAPAVSFIVATLGTNIADPIRRLKAIRASTRRAKQMMEGMSRESIEGLTMTLLSPQTLQAMTGLEGRTRPVFNLTVSNVPGPTEHLYLRGARLEAMYPVSAITHGQALNITCYSYAGTLSFGFAGCRDTLPRMQRIAVYTGEALEELEAALASRAGEMHGSAAEPEPAEGAPPPKPRSKPKPRATAKSSPRAAPKPRRKP